MPLNDQAGAEARSLERKYYVRVVATVAATKISAGFRLPAALASAGWALVKEQSWRRGGGSGPRCRRHGISHGRREVDHWLPIFSWDEIRVWSEIIASGLSWHPAYDLGSAPGARGLADELDRRVAMVLAEACR